MYNNAKSLLTRLCKDFKINIQLYLLLIIPLAYIITFHYVPMYGAQIAFRKYNFIDGIWGSKWVGLEHFKNFFSFYRFTRVLFNTLGISVYSLLAGFPIPIILALSLNNSNFLKLKKTVQMVTYAPYFISTIVMVGLIMQFLSPKYGIVNQIIRFLGFQDVMFMGEASMFKSIYVWSGIWQYAGWSSIIYISVLSGIDPTLYEAATVDGAGRLRRIIHIDIPGIVPTMTIMIILSLGNLMSVGFDKVLLMQNPMNLESSEIISTYMYKVGIAAGIPNYSYGAAIGLFNSLVNFILILAVNAIAKKVGETSLW